MDTRDLSRRVSDKDMQRIQDALSKEFKTVFTRELERGGYEITTELASDVLILRHWADRLVKALDAAHGKDKD